MEQLLNKGRLVPSAQSSARRIITHNNHYNSNAITQRTFQAELESLDPIGQDGVNVTSAGLGKQYEEMWRVSFVGTTVEGDVEAMQVSSPARIHARAQG